MEGIIIALLFVCGVVWPVLFGGVVWFVVKQRATPLMPQPAQTQASAEPTPTAAEKRLIQQLENFYNYNGTARNQLEIDAHED